MPITARRRADAVRADYRKMVSPGELFLPADDRKSSPSAAGGGFDLRRDPSQPAFRKHPVDDFAELRRGLGAGDLIAEGARAGDAGEVADGELAHHHRAPALALALDHRGVMAQQQRPLLGVGW